MSHNTSTATATATATATTTATATATATATTTATATATVTTVTTTTKPLTFSDRKRLAGGGLWLPPPKRHDSGLTHFPNPTSYTETIELLLSFKSTPLHAASYRHKLYGRQEAMEKIGHVAISNFRSRGSNSHKDHRFILVPGGSGIGKSRIGFETSHLLHFIGDLSKSYDSWRPTHP
eukprot:TRINITY_DN8283_c0_g1_i5.p1 TRINITY_DN8283_c0_g1~~TRINITY_DN8283_c0_g1_i5.p1  ORF type:complete len:178 (-),score=13.51 TRINITY_DN8283_c0_g1_i5:1739-2272(-)